MAKNKIITKMFPKEYLTDYVLMEIIDEECPLKFIESSAWEAEHKGEMRKVIFEFEGLYYLVMDYKTSSYFTEWHLESDYWPEEVECTQVEEVPKTTYEWQPVRD